MGLELGARGAAIAHLWTEILHLLVAAVLRMLEHHLNARAKTYAILGLEDDIRVVLAQKVDD